MITKYDKKGPELLAIDNAMFLGIETLALQFKKVHDNKNADFMELIKSILSKYPSVIEKNNELAIEARRLSKELAEFADHTEQLFPLTKSIEQK